MVEAGVGYFGAHVGQVEAEEEGEEEEEVAVEAHMGEGLGLKSGWKDPLVQSG